LLKLGTTDQNYKDSFKCFKEIVELNPHHYLTAQAKDRMCEIKYELGEFTLDKNFDLDNCRGKICISVDEIIQNSVSPYLPVIVKPEITLPVFYYKNELARRFWAENSNLPPHELDDGVKSYIEYNRKVKNSEIKEVWRECLPEETKRIFVGWERILNHEEVRRRKYGPY